MRTKSESFIITSRLFSGYGRNKVSAPICIKCGLGEYKVIANNITCKLQCDRCLYEIHYMRIRRNEE